jgi:TPR repeat protein
MKMRNFQRCGVPFVALLVLALAPLAQAQEADFSEPPGTVVGAEPEQAETPDAIVDQAMDVFGSGDVIQAMQILQPVAKQGHPRAQVRLGYIYDQSRYYTEALHWYRQAAEAGNTEAIMSLATMYAAGEGTDPDPAAAGQWMRKAADSGEARAMMALASAYEHGQMGLSVDFEQAVHWYKRAAENGLPHARRRLVEAYTKGELGLTQDAEAAQQWLLTTKPE